MTNALAAALAAPQPHPRQAITDTLEEELEL